MPVIDGKYVTPCKLCKHKETLTVLEPCWSCISNEDLMAPRYGDSTYHHFEKADQDGGEAE